MSKHVPTELENVEMRLTLITEVGGLVRDAHSFARWINHEVPDKELPRLVAMRCSDVAALYESVASEYEITTRSSTLNVMQAIAQRMLIMAAKDVATGGAANANNAKAWVITPDIGGITFRRACEIMGYDMERSQRAILSGDVYLSAEAAMDEEKKRRLAKNMKEAA